ncbi:MAG TPA: hypothetical protein VIG76_09470 [Amnibacterium sp.]|jgi:uncharacterized protein YdeI (YjbR/CyaY-like superfamily)|uniref:YdeI/OmpD-associated family protein n=1 Tax=Amnibacterium sp. TaxID=1872496 RepID=UPI002F949EB1
MEADLLVVADAAAWEAWLEAEHAAADRVLLAIPKKGSGAPGPSLVEAIEVAMCFGWVDSRLSRVDERFSAAVFTPRRPRSSWSPRNRGVALRLIAEGRMRPAGLLQVERAQADGRWPAEESTG